jgi:hypothetical protein
MTHREASANFGNKMIHDARVDNAVPNTGGVRESLERKGIREGGAEVLVGGDAKGYLHLVSARQLRFCDSGGPQKWPFSKKEAGIRLYR